MAAIKGPSRNHKLVPFGSPFCRIPRIVVRKPDLNSYHRVFPWMRTVMLQSLSPDCTCFNSLLPAARSGFRRELSGGTDPTWRDDESQQNPARIAANIRHGVAKSPTHCRQRQAGALHMRCLEVVLSIYRLFFLVVVVTNVSGLREFRLNVS